MRTVCGTARRVQVLVGAWRPAVVPVAAVRPLAAGRNPLLSERLGDQRHGGVRLDQVDGTTCGSAVLVALAAWADPAEVRRLDGPGDDAAGGRAAVGAPVAAPATAPVLFGSRYDARQKQVHRESTRFWPQALGTSPWGMVAWLRRHLPAAGPYRVRLVDDVAARDVADVVADVESALRSGRPVPLLVGALVPRHYVMAVGLQEGAWKVYEPTSGQIRAVDPSLVGRRTLGALLGFDRLHAALLPS
ncbi:hypothetical protein I4I73_22195 [Pseudonocardia sp. KRD-184]|uniref:Peptidase C39-like protein n=1 Tax=Pseudonocardia oceani TaxID=2792013 RepID=A0ABS6U560_9PSEU|nr:hypothetical protein [Pseudonocardia oceani]MBW0091728.1 hypothetical protein [Pseudonocardia oceani]MBW0098703.1 hypothetical protein [Pseudonocardia oceani]MBW0111206.1 hypothetical protein [Pseudonocardia oceani]MBW0125087.1 hypothetical protein [Pseudonocardia oceani]MBW0127371.1 hypothetical protein [Pseudonocardia oceani]